MPFRYDFKPEIVRSLQTIERARAAVGMKSLVFWDCRRGKHVIYCMNGQIKGGSKLVKKHVSLAAIAYRRNIGGLSAVYRRNKKILDFIS